MSYSKTNPNIEIDEFINKTKSIIEFISSSGKRYKVSSNNGEYLKFNRLDGKKPEMEWSINLKRLYSAYKVLDDFSTANLKPFVNRTHSPARGLLIKMSLLK